MDSSTGMIRSYLQILLIDYWGMANWFGAHDNQEVRFSSAVKCEKGPQVLTSLLNQNEIIIRNNK